MSFDLDEALTLPQDLIHHQNQKISTSETLAAIDITTNGVTNDDRHVCSVCMESFKAGESCKQVACGHVYHQSCISTWFFLHNSCPLCRCKISQGN
ncbi:hypothetical protein FEM48_Zijuj12G0139500 [Ziziphus jujuba var. spinosa]|uniref:RING-type domain-containing protein n=1 Tax=Ziziphus jujuba var. spinosa TaxID=714518 RepID=A0A978UDR0_ZIZJJ|nr:hypothetical protein FEM48_Zijuj12G0139500 [Ziziphus jujuba var. spinosa]